MTHDPDAAIKLLQDSLQADRPFSFAQADSLVSHLLSCIDAAHRRRYSSYSNSLGLFWDSAGTKKLPRRSFVLQN